MLEFLRNKKIMIVVAHPDDELLGLGATLHRLINDYNVKTHVVILGEGDERLKLESDIRTMMPAIRNRIRIVLPGYRQDAAECIGAFDLFVMPSVHEGFGLTLVEAMAHGIPVLANRVDSLPELIEEYENGECIDFTYENQDEVIQKILTYARKEKASPVTKFDINTMVGSYVELFNTLLSRQKRTRYSRRDGSDSLII